MLRFLYLFGVETVGDVLIRFMIHMVYKINCGKVARNHTVLNYRTRFLFGIFVVYFICSTYYSLVRLGNIL